jgi:hypothetical protein
MRWRQFKAAGCRYRAVKGTGKVMSDTPLYDAMIEAIDECVAKDTLDNATIDDLEALVKIATNHEPERMLREIRQRADKEVCKAMGMRYRKR